MAQNKNNFFSRLNRLFASNVVVVPVGGKKLKVMDVDHGQFFNKTSSNILYDKFNRLYRSPNLAASANFSGNFPYLQQRLSLFNDYELMDMDPTLATALDIFSDECLGSDTIIPLLDGTKKTIKELYENNSKDFWIYSLDESLNKFMPAKCEKVAYNGKKKMYKITLDDNTEILSTENHMWVTPSGLKYTRDLNISDGITTFESKKSTGFIIGYEQLKQNNVWGYTHKLVFNSNDSNKKEFNNLRTKYNEQVVIHHKNFDKLNNTPDNLQCMTWTQHKEFHSSSNSLRWKVDIKYAKI